MSLPHRIAIGQRSDVFLLQDFLDAAECRHWIEFGERRGFEQATISTALGQVHAAEVRNNDRLILDDPDLAERWFQRAAPFLPPAFGNWRLCGLNERFRLYRYRPGQKFAAHRDGSYERHAGELSWLTLMVYLNAGFEGGGTRFDLAGEPEPLRIVPVAGMALVFMHDRRHEGEEVTAGVKYVLRTDVMYRRES